ncbi:hypothetical protein MNBD_GAMMA21-137 [hydrothermal vent metagenome]|uniref:Uncharacterized protein n=1 Tax=hydrothermal vent metagenome TaxID=652676 RepID=A0A3B1AIX2_9ZZZZ
MVVIINIKFNDINDVISQENIEYLEEEMEYENNNIPDADTADEEKYRHYSSKAGICLGLALYNYQQDNDAALIKKYLTDAVSAINVSQSLAGILGKRKDANVWGFKIGFTL